MLSIKTECIAESMKLPLLEGILEIDTTFEPITICMVPPNHCKTLELIKISDDANMITLLCLDSQVNGADIIMFGLSPKSAHKFGKNKHILLQGCGKNWKILSEM